MPRQTDIETGDTGQTGEPGRTRDVGDDAVLDNPVWSALTGPQRRFGAVRDDAAAFDPDFAPFVAFAGRPTASAWTQMADLVGSERTVILTGDAPLPTGWTVVRKGPGVQMVCDGLRDRLRQDLPDGCRLVDLGIEDLDDLRAVIAAARPGPFAARTHELGRFVGVRHGDRLVAVAGERLRLPGYTEVSAVATLPSHRRRGLGTAVVHRVAAGIVADGAVPCLSAAASNTAAIAVYADLGFRHRGSLDFRWLRRDGPT